VKQLIGVAILPVFVNKGTRIQVDTDQPIREYSLNSGSFQLPLYGNFPEWDLSLTAKDWIDLPRVPCATLLVRILPAPMSADRSKSLSYNDIPEEQWANKKLVLFFLPPPLQCVC
jgi:hypothetical protein